jgi:c(7)-type cytochrome triheme protein
MGFPATSFCMSCHQTVKAESPHIQKMAAIAKEKQPIPWVRVYRIPNYVYFSHRVHTAAGATCEACHGPVRERDVITKEVVHNMSSCMACHAAKKARNDCTACHEERG